jgi:hypothetical protein
LPKASVNFIIMIGFHSLVSSDLSSSSDVGHQSDDEMNEEEWRGIYLDLKAEESKQM